MKAKEMCNANIMKQILTRPLEATHDHQAILTFPVYSVFFLPSNAERTSSLKAEGLLGLDEKHSGD